MGASKMNDAAACREAIAAGIDALGENRVQEMVQKLEQHAYDGAPLHFIGHLQRNKVKQVVGHVALIQSVGSLELLEEIEKVAAARDLVQDILLEVNIGREAAKSGFAPERCPRRRQRPALELPHVRVRGLMTIPPADAQRDANFRYFQEVQALYVDMNEKLFHNELEYLSMGMSGDYRGRDPRRRHHGAGGQRHFRRPPLQLRKTGARLRWEAYYELIGRTEKVDPPLRG